MFDFFKDLEKKKAFLRALREVDEEDNIGVSVNEEKVKKSSARSVERVYHSMVKEEETIGSKEMVKPKTAFHKPETTAVDLKNFKDWRKVKTVESKQPNFGPSRRRLLFDDIDEGVGESKLEFPGGNFEYKAEPGIDSTNVISSMNPQKEEVKSARSSLRDILARASERKNVANDFNSESEALTTSASPFKRTKAIESNEKPIVEPKVKVEVVDFDHLTNPEKLEKVSEVKLNEDKPNEEKVSKPSVKSNAAAVAKKRTRGKAKKRFDADVINSVDWK